MNLTELRKPLNAVDDLDDETLCWAAVELVWPGRGVVNEMKHVESATPGQQAVFATMLFAREMDNGGFEQFFYNGSGVYWRQVRAGLELFGAKELIRAFATALDVFPEAKPPLDEQERRDLLDGINMSQNLEIRSEEERIGGFEAALTPYWVSYIRSNPREFFILNA